MPKETLETLKCPKCGQDMKMKKNKVGIFVCPKCGGAFVPEPDSIFGVH